MEKWSLIVVSFLFVSSVQCADPCTDYIEINDTKLTTSYEPKNEAGISCQEVSAFNWFRYTGTDDGLLTDVCPTGRQCGSHSQIWINGTCTYNSFPDVTDGERMTKVCIHTGTSCCSNKNFIKMKNCSDFMLYFFVPTPPCVNYCFHSPQTGDTGNGEGKIRNTEIVNKKDSKKTWILPLSLVLGGAALGVIIIIVGFIIRPYCRKQQMDFKNNRDHHIARKKFNSSAYFTHQNNESTPTLDA